MSFGLSQFQSCLLFELNSDLQSHCDLEEFLISWQCNCISVCMRVCVCVHALSLSQHTKPVTSLAKTEIQ